MDSKLDITANGCPFWFLWCQGRETVWPQTYCGCRVRVYVLWAVIAWMPMQQKLVLICLVDDGQHFRDAIIVDFPRRTTTMVNASVGRERSQIRSGNARPIWKTVHEPVKNEDGEDQVNGIDTTETCLLLSRTCLFASAWIAWIR